MMYMLSQFLFPQLYKCVLDSLLLLQCWEVLGNVPTFSEDDFKTRNNLKLNLITALLRWKQALISYLVHVSFTFNSQNPRLETTTESLGSRFRKGFRIRLKFEFALFWVIISNHFRVSSFSMSTHAFLQFTEKYWSSAIITTWKWQLDLGRSLDMTRENTFLGNFVKYEFYLSCM